MVSINRKIMGTPINIDILDNETTEFDVNCAVDLANQIYEQVRKEEDQKENGIVDTDKLKTIAIFRIVLELQTIKGKQEVFLDTNAKRMNELIKLVESIDSPI
ncbi:MAG: hypothetical protein K5622_07100 [Endomicrobiaceae bacterium]|nr:hypothetical protein [Endomicrobiaceae bacterium]